MAYYSTIIYYDYNNAVDLHQYAADEQDPDIKILYYGLAVKGKGRDGRSAKNKMVTIIQIDADDPEDLCSILDAAGWELVVRHVRDDIADGSFDNTPFGWTSKSGRIPAMIQRMGTRYGVACVYDFNAVNNGSTQQSKIFTYGDKASTVKMFNNDIENDVAVMFNDMSGTGAPAEFQIDSKSITADMTSDGKVRLCFAVHMNGSKNDFADVGLQTKINELRQAISIRYGVDVDIVDIRSTIEYS